MNDQQGLPWVNAFDAKDGATGLIVRVQRKGDYRPRYSIQIGKKRENVDEDRLGSYLAVFVDGYGQGKITANRSMEGALPNLLKQAHDFIEADAQNYENLNTDRRITRDERDSDRNGNGHGHRRTGKTDRNRDKRRRRDDG